MPSCKLINAQIDLVNFKRVWVYLILMLTRFVLQLFYYWFLGQEQRSALSGFQASAIPEVSAITLTFSFWKFEQSTFKGLIRVLVQATSASYTTCILAVQSA